jgi:muramidase (phage lysozyme)
MTDERASAFNASPSGGSPDLVQRFDLAQPPVSPSVLGPVPPDSSFTNVLWHMAMGGDPDDLPPSEQHIAPHASLLLAAQPPAGPGLLGDTSTSVADTQPPSAEGDADDGSEDEDDDQDDDDQVEGQADADAPDGPEVPAAPGRAPVGPLDTNPAVPTFTPRPEVARAAAANQRRAMAMTQAQTDLKNPQVQALLAVVRDGESGNRYDAIVNSKQGFSDFSRHPNVRVLVSPPHLGPDGKMTPALHSTAAGAYQMNKGTWDGAASAIGLTDFQPRSQDLAAAYVLRQTKAVDKLQEGDVPGAIHAGASQGQIFPKADGNAIAGPGQTPKRPKIDRWLKAYNDKLGQSK